MSAAPAKPDGSPAAIGSDSGGVPLRVKLAYGCGQISDSLGLNGVKQISQTVYVVLLGVSPAWIGLVLAAVRLWDAFIDPIVGRISDRHRSRFGRRKPLILAGSLVMMLVFPLLWAAQPGWSAELKVAYFSVGLLVFFVGYAVFSVPFQAMGMELTQDYHQRTSVQAVRTVFGASTTVLLYWFAPLAFLPVFSDGLSGMVWVGAGVGLIIGLCALPALKWIPVADPAPQHRPDELGLMASLRTAFAHRPLRLLVLTVGLGFLGVNLAFGLNNLINIYYVFHGDVKAALVVNGFAGTLWSACSMSAAPLIGKLSRRIGKKRALACCLSSILLGSLLYLVAFSPAHPYMQLIPVIFVSPGIAGIWVLGPSMLADVCDVDQLEHGVRREATFSAVYAWVQKLALSISFALSGYLTVLCGFEVAQGANQAAGVFWAMKLVLAFTPVLVLAPGFWLLARYPLDESAVRANRARLDAASG